MWLSGYHISQDLSRNETTMTTSNKNTSMYLKKEQVSLDSAVDKVEQVLLARIWQQIA
jgi:hypothetical protein